LKQTSEVGRDLVKAIGVEKINLMLGQAYIADHKDEARESYLSILTALADEFHDRKFVLIFDQFENVGKASTDFFLNFAKFIMMQNRFHIIVSIRTDYATWNNPVSIKFHEDFERMLKRELGAKKMSLEGICRRYRQMDKACSKYFASFEYSSKDKGELCRTAASFR
jgi:hypothetical protein